ncbi:hypothetical protein NQ317_002399 [Molorchus minor]|uniref:Uncharacterized protein n=1 Tax=Molorchus minor TaxID=1323400 RepID=A0ABQ9J8M0_9CUCU|nr:hypothetical protein NQ317_002399 [Molorchus minor]
MQLLTKSVILVAFILLQRCLARTTTSMLTDCSDICNPEMGGMKTECNDLCIKQGYGNGICIHDMDADKPCWHCDCVGRQVQAYVTS